MNLSAQKMTKDKKAVVASVEKHKENLIKISDSIWALAETAFEESISAELLADYAEQFPPKTQELRVNQVTVVATTCSVPPV